MRRAGGLRPICDLWRRMLAMMAFKAARPLVPLGRFRRECPRELVGRLRPASVALNRTESNPRFNKGQGFNAAAKDYFFKTQRKAGINETVVPLDVLDALIDSRKQANPAAGKVRRYPCLQRQPQARLPTNRPPPGRSGGV